MDVSQASLNLLSHFDVPAVDLADAAPEVVGGIETTPQRGVGWVLRSAAVVGVLFYATTVLVEFAHCVAAEQLLGRAARAGALEATLPQATLQTIKQTVWRRLEGRLSSQADLNVALLQNGKWIGKRFWPSGGDQLTVTLTMPAQAIMPSWLRGLTCWRGDAQINAQAHRAIPDRKLIGSANRQQRKAPRSPAPTARPVRENFPDRPPPVAGNDCD
jgi:hypothetical protein